MLSAIIVTLRAALFFLWCMATVPAQFLVLAFTRGPASYFIPSLWQRGICRMFSIRVIVEGSPLRDRQTLYVANHISYLDIPAMGSVLRASFISKKEVANWPVFGTLARLQQTAFISRSRADAHREKNAISNMIAEGKNLILFPEGTSTDGRDVAPFKSSLFSMTLEDNQRPVMIQPVTQRLESVNGKPADDQAARDIYAWYGDMTMPPHLKGFAGSRGAVIRLIFHSPIDPRAFEDRKSLAEACENAVRSGLQPVIATGLAA